MRHLILLPLLLVLLSCGGGGGAKPAPEPEPELGIIYIENHGTVCFDCMTVYKDGELSEQACGRDPLCPGETADAVTDRGHYYDISMWTSDGLWVVDFPTFFFDSPTYTLTITP